MKRKVADISNHAMSWKRLPKSESNAFDKVLALMIHQTKVDKDTREKDRQMEEAERMEGRQCEKKNEERSSDDVKMTF